MPGATAVARLEAPGPRYHGDVSTPERSPSSWPQVSDYAVEPESGEELFDGEVREAAPAGPLHSRQHSQVDFVLRAYAAADYGADTDLLTRQAVEHNFASDTCIRKNGVDPATGDRYLEELAFEIKSTQRAGDLERRTRIMAARGVRRIFAIPVRGDATGSNLVAGPLAEWMHEEGRWRTYGNDEIIEDPCLYEPLPVRALLDAVEADDAVAQALLDKGNRVLVRFGDDRYRAGAEEAARELIQLLLHDRGILIDAAAQERIAGCRDLTVLRRWAVRAARVASASQLFDEG
jgi:hypothetical protein